MGAPRAHGFQCTRCGVPMRTIASRETTGGIVRRRRRCKPCDERITTYEVPITTGEIVTLNCGDGSHGRILVIRREENLWGGIA